MKKLKINVGVQKTKDPNLGNILLSKPKICIYSIKFLASSFYNNVVYVLVTTDF